MLEPPFSHLDLGPLLSMVAEKDTAPAARKRQDAALCGEMRHSAWGCGRVWGDVAQCGDTRNCAEWFASVRLSSAECGTMRLAVVVCGITRQASATFGGTRPHEDMSGSREEDV